MEGACTQGKAVERFCLNCDNRHGCKTKKPVCVGIEPSGEERFMSGQKLMARRGLLLRCRRCGHFRQCWSSDKYRGALRRAGETI